MRWLWLVTFGACAPHTDGAVAPKRSASRASLDLIRAYPDADKIFVQARLPDGTDAVFLVDTGAGISTVSADVAERLNLKVTDGGYVEGVAGRAAWRKSPRRRVCRGGTTPVPRRSGCSSNPTGASVTRVDPGWPTPVGIGAKRRLAG